MRVDALEPASLEAQLGGIAGRLTDIAGCVAAEAETATVTIRGMTDHAHRIASLAAALEAASSAMAASVHEQVETLARARTALDTNKPTIDALARSANGVAAVSAAVAQIARESRILSLNARVEAARAGDPGRAFAVVAAEMSTLTNRTKLATDEIGERATAIAHDVEAANLVVASHASLVVGQDELLAASSTSAMQQHETATQLASITAETADVVDTAAAAIGRVGANAVAVKLLARQIAKLAKS